MIKPKSYQQNGVKEAPMLHLSIAGSFSSPAGITWEVQLSVGRGSLNHFGIREFSSILGSAAIIAPLCVSLMPAHRAPAQKVDLWPGFQGPSGLAVTLAQWRLCGPVCSLLRRRQSQGLICEIWPKLQGTKALGSPECQLRRGNGRALRSGAGGGTAGDTPRLFGSAQ